MPASVDTSPASLVPSGALAGEVAVITGAAGGIGREVALVFAGLGAAVVVADIADGGRDTARAIEEAGGRALFVPCDVSSEEEVAALARRTGDAFGAAGILVNNAIVAPVASVLETEPPLWDKVLGVNLRGPFLTCRAFLPGMIERRRGTVINLVSTDAMPFLSAYIASKQGLVGFSQSLAAEVGPLGVRVVAFVPGIVDTPGWRRAARNLAPRLDMTYEEFMAMTMPAERAAWATASLVALLAEDYHGEVVDGYTVLERVEAAPAEYAVAPVAPAASAGAASAAAEAQALAERLADVLAQTEAETARLPLFVRPMARRGLRKKTGRTIEEWRRDLSDLLGHLERAGADEGAPAGLRPEWPKRREALARLALYYREVPAEFARFTRDGEAVRQVAEISAGREAAVTGLVAAMDRLLGR